MSVAVASPPLAFQRQSVYSSLFFSIYNSNRTGGCLRWEAGEGSTLVTAFVLFGAHTVGRSGWNLEGIV